MGYFDALTSGTFKTGQDGQRLFFPWGTLGRGYVIESESDYERLRQQVKAFLAVGLILIIGLMSVRAYLLGLAVAAMWYVLYIVWTARTLRGRQSSKERLTSREVMAVQARTHSLIFLWAAAIGSLGFLAAGIFLLAVSPHQWLTAGGGILLGGFGAFRFSQMTLVRRQQ
jgi:hypothetical protein